jgi:hypothetical protein
MDTTTLLTHHCAACSRWRLVRSGALVLSQLGSQYRLGERRSNPEAAMFPQKSCSALLSKSLRLIAALSAVTPVAIAGPAVADPLEASQAANEKCLANGYPHETCCKGSGGTWDPDKSECASPGPAVATPNVQTPDTMPKTPRPHPQ